MCAEEPPIVPHFYAGRNWSVNLSSDNQIMSCSDQIHYENFYQPYCLKPENLDQSITAFTAQ